MTGEREVLVTGVGVVSAAGESPDALAAAVREGRPLASEITAFEVAEGEPARACEIHEFDLARHVPSVKSYIDRTSALALAATKAALEDAGVFEDGARGGREVGLVYGTQWGCLDSMEVFYAKLKGSNPRFAPPLPFSHSYANSPASVLAIEFALRGHHAVYSTGRTSGARAVLAGADAVESGRAGAVACVASDSFSHAAFRHYHAKGLLRPDDGTEDDPRRFFLGEGASCLVLEDAGAARSRGARVRARVLGSGAAPGSGAAAALEVAIRKALARAGVEPAKVRAAFGTSASREGTEVELAALVASLGVGEGRAREMLLSTGMVLGETMGASGALAATAACAGGLDGPAVVLSAELAPTGPSAVAVLLAPAS
ncbi:MAG: beta-ketoacyl synthase N-terminal-like domain-containing protein [Planctomycetota bacterium]|jgi:3-oxoacyl-(acyl-carrier-protein) synthase